MCINHARSPGRFDQVRKMIEQQGLPRSTLDQYLRWLGDYIATGGEPTNYIDHTFETEQKHPWFRFSYAAPGSEVVVFDGECGILSRRIIAAPGAHVSCEGFSHTDVYRYDDQGRAVFGFSPSDKLVAPVFSDSKFDSVLPASLRRERDERFAVTRRGRVVGG